MACDLDMGCKLSQKKFSIYPYGRQSFYDFPAFAYEHFPMSMKHKLSSVAYKYCRAVLFVIPFGVK